MFPHFYGIEWPRPWALVPWVAFWPDSGILAAPRDGAWIWIFNHTSTAKNLSVKQPDGSTPLATINQNESGLFYADADAADDSNAGWKLMALFTIALG